MEVQSFALSIDGTNDTGLEKMNPLTVGIYNISSKQVHFYFLDVCITTGQGAGTAESIFLNIYETLILHNIPWTNCVAIGLDNTIVNIGKETLLNQGYKSSRSLLCCGFSLLFDS